MRERPPNDNIVRVWPDAQFIKDDKGVMYRRLAEYDIIQPGDRYEFGWRFDRSAPSVKQQPFDLQTVTPPDIGQPVGAMQKLQLITFRPMDPLTAAMRIALQRRKKK